MSIWRVIFILLGVALVIWYSIGGFGIKFHKDYVFEWEKCSSGEMGTDGIKTIERKEKVLIVKGVRNENCATIGIDGTYQVDGNKISIKTESYQYAIALCKCAYDVTYKIRNLPEQNYIPHESQKWTKFELPKLKFDLNR